MQRPQAVLVLPCNGRRYRKRAYGHEGDAEKPDEYKEVLGAHRVDTAKYEQQAEQMRQETPDAAEKRQEPDSESQTTETEQQQAQPQQTPAEEGYKPIDDSRLDRTEVAERWGIDLAALEQSGDLERMRNYGKSRLIDCNPEIGGIRIAMQARLSLRENPDGTVSLVPHPIRRAPNYDEYLNVKFTAEDRDNLKRRAISDVWQKSSIRRRANCSPRLSASTV